MQSSEQAVKAVLTNPYFLVVWCALMSVSLAILIWDLRRNNPHLMSLMKWVWGFTVLYSGPLGLAIYWFSGRKQIAGDSLWRKSFRSVSHCYSGCGMGEIVGVLITVGLLGLGNWPTAIVTFVLAYVAGFALTAGPLIQDGESVSTALWDAFVSESASITVMEISAICLDLWLGGSAQIHQPLFWSSLVLSLTVGLVAAYPINVLLIYLGIKEGMHNPKHMGHGEHAGHEQHRYREMSARQERQRQSA